MVILRRPCFVNRTWVSLISHRIIIIRSSSFSFLLFCFLLPLLLFRIIRFGVRCSVLPVLPMLRPHPPGDGAILCWKEENNINRLGIIWICSWRPASCFAIPYSATRVSFQPFFIYLFILFVFGSFFSFYFCAKLCCVDAHGICILRGHCNSNRRANFTIYIILYRFRIRLFERPSA